MLYIHILFSFLHYKRGRLARFSGLQIHSLPELATAPRSLGSQDQPALSPRERPGNLLIPPQAISDIIAQVLEFGGHER